MLKKDVNCAMVMADIQSIMTEVADVLSDLSDPAMNEFDTELLMRCGVEIIQIADALTHRGGYR